MPAAEDVKRQVAVTVVVAVEVPALLLAVHGIVGSIEINDDARWRPVVGVEEEIDNQPLDCLRVMVELVVPVTADLARMLEPIERRLAGEPVTGLVEHGGERFGVASRSV